MPAPADPTVPLVDPAAVAQTSGILCQLAASDHSPVGAALAALVATTGRHHTRLPTEVAASVMDVVHAVDAATGRRR